MSSAETYSYDVQLARSDAPGRPWRRIGPVHHDGTPTEHGFVSFARDGSELRAFWLDGREMKGEGEGDMTLRTTLIGKPGAKEERLDACVCECCQTSAATTAEGPLIVYRDRSEKEIRDIAVVRRVSGSWSEPLRIAADGWEIAGCPVNGPSVDARDRTVAVAWFTGAQGRGRVQVAFSPDAGASFGKPAVVDAHNPLGRVGLALDTNGDALVSWVAGAPKPSIRVARVRRSGTVGPPFVVSETSAARTSGFPLVKRSANKLAIAWVDAGHSSRLRAGVLRTSALR
jgi:hypothetical protein